MWKSHSNLEDKDSPSSLKDDFSSRTDSYILTSIALTYETSQTKQAEFFQQWNQKAIFCVSV